MFPFIIAMLTGFATLITGLVIGAFSATKAGRKAGASIAVVGVIILVTLFIFVP